jgi:uncharacterized protein YjiS (DUF1127 family)
MIMSTTTLDTVITAGRVSDARPSWLKRLFAAIVASREAQARRMIASEFSRMSEQRLADLGFTPEQARRIRQTGTIPADYWA